MINLFHRHQQGAATLLITTILMVSMTLIVIFAANYSIMQQKISANGNRNQQAYEAAEAGLEYGINYLQTNSATILANPVSGFIPAYSDSNTNNVALANGAHYTITYSNPVANNYNLIKVSSSGTSDDATSTRVVSQLVEFGSLAFSLPTFSLTTQGNSSMTGSSQVTNLETHSTIRAGDDVSFSGSSQTTINTGTGSNRSAIGSDVQQNISSLSSMTANDFFAHTFGLSSTTVKNDSVHYYANLGNYTNTLNGLTGTSIWIDQASGSAAISGSPTIGSAASPVLIIVNGNLHISGSAVIYGLIFVIGGTVATLDISGSPQIIGGILSTGDLNISGSASITYNSTVLKALQKTTGNYYAKVPGSWRDF